MLDRGHELVGDRRIEAAGNRVGHVEDAVAVVVEGAAAGEERPHLDGIEDEVAVRSVRVQARKAP